jgi:hypothetical protein
MLADEDNNSDTNSELLMLASSLFNNIDSLEYNSIGSGEIDSGEIDSSELDSSDDSTSALEIAFSLRKMRSGKIVRYHNEK